VKPRSHRGASTPPSRRRQRSAVAAPASRTLAALLAVLTVVPFAACGVRTMPRAPEDTAPQAPDKLEATANGQGATITWDRPTKTADGSRLYDLAKFLVERQTGSGDFQTIATIDVTDLDRIRPQQTFKYVDTEVPPGTVHYRVRAVTKDGESGIPAEPVAIATTAPAGDGATGKNTPRSTEAAK
jgi:hypothetical protein